VNFNIDRFSSRSRKGWQYGSFSLQAMPAPAATGGNTGQWRRSAGTVSRGQTLGRPEPQVHPSGWLRRDAGRLLRR
jgi:hypothetical protein